MTRGHCILSHGFESGPDATKVTALAEVAERLGVSTDGKPSKKQRRDLFKFQGSTQD